MKIAKYSRALVIACGLLWMGCAGSGRMGSGRIESGRIESQRSAEAKAVDLANRECRARYGKAPFRTGYFPATPSDSRWLWGWLDPNRAEGFSAQVSFRDDGSDAQVEVVYSSQRNDNPAEPDVPQNAVSGGDSSP